MKKTLVFLAILSILGCTHPYVTLTSVEDVATRGGIYPPVCDSKTPEYPTAALASRSEQQVDVTVHFRVEASGEITILEPTGLNDDIFAETAVDAISKWECSPAWRLRRARDTAQNEEAGPEHVPYSTVVMVSFFRDSHTSAISRSP